MKLNLKKLMIVLTVAMLTSVNVVETKDAKKSIQACIKAAKCKETLKKHLKDNGHEHIAAAFANVKCEKSARAALKKLGLRDKIKVIAAIKQEEAHLKKILPEEEKESTVAPAA